MDLKKIAVLSCMSFLSLSAYSAPSDSTLLLDKVDRLENHILLLEKKLSELKNTESQSISTSENQASLHSRLLAVEEKMRELNGKFEHGDHDLVQMTERINKLAGDVDYRFKQLEQKAVNPTSTNLQEKPGQQISLMDKYQEMMAKGQYSKAIAGLEKFVADSKNNKDIGEGYYMLGSAYSAQKLYDKSAINYLKGYKHSPQSAKAPDSLLDLANALSKLQKNDKACNILDKLEQEYPERSSINKQETIELVGKLNCK